MQRSSVIEAWTRSELIQLKIRRSAITYIMGLFSKSSQKETQKTTMTKKVASSPDPTITIQVKEKSEKISFAIRNLKALKETGTKEIRSQIFPVYWDAGRKYRDNVVHRYELYYTIFTIKEKCHFSTKKIST